MKFKEAVRLSELADLIGAEVIGDGSMLVEGINEIHRIEKGELVFVDHPKYYDKALNSEATFILINKKVEAPEANANGTSGYLIKEGKNAGKVLKHIKTDRTKL